MREGKCNLIRIGHRLITIRILYYVVLLPTYRIHEIHTCKYVYNGNFSSLFTRTMCSSLEKGKMYGMILQIKWNPRQVYKFKCGNEIDFSIVSASTTITNRIILCDIYYIESPTWTRAGELDIVIVVLYAESYGTEFVVSFSGNTFSYIYSVCHSYSRLLVKSFFYYSEILNENYLTIDIDVTLHNEESTSLLVQKIHGIQWREYANKRKYCKVTITLKVLKVLINKISANCQVLPYYQLWIFLIIFFNADFLCLILKFITSSPLSFNKWNM